ncbi:MAG: YicC/YloC family endoribonuclease [Thermodesulfobacteriota bacterium]
MIKSMTGYGRAEWKDEDKQVEVEIKSFNHRYCDVQVHLPRRLNSFEGQVRQLVKQRVSRGRIEVFVQIDDAALAEQKLEVDLELAKDYLLGLRTLQEKLGIPGEINLEIFINFREIFTRKEVEADLEKEWAILQATIEEALTSLDRMRQEEGTILAQDFQQRLQTVAEFVRQIEERVPLALKNYQQRLRQKVQEFCPGAEVDEARLAQEIAYLAERSDISEELVRMKSHLHQFREMLERAEPMGRKLEFILQEINREANTIAAKASDAETAQLVVEIKSELEKMREQVQNVE